MTDEEMKKAATQLLTSVAALAAHDRLVALNLNQAGDKFLKLSGLINTARISVTWDGDKPNAVESVDDPYPLTDGRVYRMSFDSVYRDDVSLIARILDAEDQCCMRLDTARNIRIEEVDPIDGDNQ